MISGMGYADAPLGSIMDRAREELRAEAQGIADQTAGGLASKYAGPAGVPWPVWLAGAALAMGGAYFFWFKRR